MMSDKLLLPRLLVTVHPSKQIKERKTEAEKAVIQNGLDKVRVNIGPAFQRWRQLKELKGLRSDAMVALFLLDSYEKQTSTPWKPGLLRAPPPAGSAAAAESLSDLNHRRVGEQLQGPEEFDISMSTFKLTSVKMEEEEKPQSSQLHENQSEESRDTQHIKTEADGEDCGGAEPGRDFNPDSHLQPDTPDKTSDFSGSDTDDSGDWEERDEPQEGLQARKEFSCSLCQKDFFSRVDIVKHIRTHTGEKPFKCSVCGKRFAQNGDLRRHLATHTEEKPFKCSVCGKRFAQNGHLKFHLAVHTGEKPFMCSVCGERFARHGALRRHLAVHTGEKPLSCSNCGKKFAQNGDLRRHLAVHTGEKPFSCSLCGKRFVQNGHLRLHLIVHTGEKPFSCSVCGKKFAQNGHLRRHLVVHTGNKTFGCSVCCKKFSRLDCAKRHMLVCERRKIQNVCNAN